MIRRICVGTYAENFQGANISPEEWEFIRAIAAYQKRWKRRYPSWREVLHVAACLGYRKVAPPQPFADPLPGEQELAKSVIDSPQESPAE